MRLGAMMFAVVFISSIHFTKASDLLTLETVVPTEGNSSNVSTTNTTTNNTINFSNITATEEFTVKEFAERDTTIDPDAPPDIPNGIWRSSYKYEPKVLENPEDSKFILRPDAVTPSDITLENSQGSFTIPLVEQKQDARIALGPRQQHQSRARACSCCFKYAKQYNKEPNCATGICTCKDPVTEGKFCFSDLGVKSFRDGTEPMACSEEDMLANMCDYA